MLCLNSYLQYMIQCVQVAPINQVAEAKKDEQIEVEVAEATPAAADVNQPEQKVTPRVWMENIYENQNDASQSLSPCLSFTFSMISFQLDLTVRYIGSI